MLYQKSFYSKSQNVGWVIVSRPADVFFLVLFCFVVHFAQISCLQRRQANAPLLALKNPVAFLMESNPVFN